jgi:hypothetical protein
MKKEKEHKMATGLTVHTNLVAGWTCYDKNDADAIRKCSSQYFDRQAQGIGSQPNFQELDRCFNSC